RALTASPHLPYTTLFRSGPQPTPPQIRSHAPAGYVCPFCGLVNGDVADPNNRCELSDLIYQDDDVIVFSAADGFGPNAGHVMIRDRKSTRLNSSHVSISY